MTRPDMESPARTQSEIWRNLKDRGLYKIVSTQGRMAGDMARVTVYESLWDGSIWVMPEDEFFDGQFDTLSIDEVQSI